MGQWKRSWWAIEGLVFKNVFTHTHVVKKMSMDRKMLKTVLIILFKSLKKDSNALQKSHESGIYALYKL